MQRGVQGGRGGKQLCRSTILVQPLVTTVVKKQKRESDNTASEEPQSEEVCQKTLEEPFRRFLTTTSECLWKIIDEYYGNPVRDGR